MQASHLLNSAPGERDRCVQVFSGRNDTEEEGAEEVFRALDQTVYLLTNRLCESISPGEDKLLRMEEIWKSWQINLHNIIVKNRETVLGCLHVEIGRGVPGLCCKPQFA
jgi:hypothetical protein